MQCGVTSSRRNPFYPLFHMDIIQQLSTGAHRPLEQCFIQHCQVLLHHDRYTRMFASSAVSSQCLASPVYKEFMMVFPVRRYFALLMI